jgi:threonine dehydrogenase-like Zn-dependent dehydrogenase
VCSSDLKPLISARVPLDRAIEAFESATSRGTLKVLLEMTR